MSDKQTLESREPQREDYMKWLIENRDNLSNICRDIGASSEFIRVINTPSDGRRHSFVMTLYRHHEYEDRLRKPRKENVEEAKELAGGAFTELWKGNLYRAWRCADSNNRHIMRNAFEKYEVVADAPSRIEDINW